MSVEPTNFAQMVAGSEAVVKAEVLEVSGAWVGEGAERRIVTTVRLRVREAAKGLPKTEEMLTLEFLGGTAPDGRRMVVVGMPEFRVGATEILFVQTADRSKIWENIRRTWLPESITAANGRTRPGF